MARNYVEFDRARAIRADTLSLVSKLDQGQSEHRANSGKWSVGEVLDHLVKLDTLIVRELEVALNQSSRGLPFVYRGIADVDTTIPWVLRPVLPLVEVPFGFFNTVLPQSVRRAFTGNRTIPLQAPGIIEPRFGRPIDTLRAELDATFHTLEQQQADKPGIDLNRLYYYNPITGLSSVAGLYRFVSNHEQRHQSQLRDILAHGSFPEPAKSVQVARGPSGLAHDSQSSGRAAPVNR